MPAKLGRRASVALYPLCIGIYRCNVRFDLEIYFDRERPKEEMTQRFPRLRRWLDSWVTPPPVVSVRRTWADGMKAGVSWLFISTVVSILRLVLWFLDRK
jgi:hypothetical protein